ncbi:MAG: DUF177 domain-containing protein [Eubacteriales bacterium]|nr:DUF177 domain-containing protein [Eubacteriales bacterium]
MELDVTKALQAPGTVFPFTASVVLPPQDVIGETVTFDAVSLRGQYSTWDGAVRLAGEMTTTAHAICALCLQPADIPMSLPFDETFRRDVNELEDDAFVYEGNRVALFQMTLTLIMLNLPMRFVCQEDCEGSEAYRTFNQQELDNSNEEEPRTQRPFEALQSLLDEEVGKAD